MDLGSAGSRNGSQPILLNDSPKQHIHIPKNLVKFPKIFATMVATVTFVMGFTCTMGYIYSAPDLSITGWAKKAVFMVFLMWSSIPMLTSVVAIMVLICAQHLSDNTLKIEAILGGTALVLFAFVSMLIALIVGVYLVAILLPWYAGLIVFMLVAPNVTKGACFLFEISSSCLSDPQL